MLYLWFVTDQGISTLYFSAVGWCVTILLQAVAAGHAAISSMCQQLTEWAARVGKAKRPERVLPPAGLGEALAELAGHKVEELYR